MATGTSRTVSAPVFHGDDPEQIADYRTLSVLAIISLAIGLIAPIAVYGTFLYVIPIVGIALSLLALRRIAVSEGLLAGQWAATVGLVLSVASIVAPVSYHWIQQSIRTSQAEAFGRQWVAIVTSGDVKGAYKLTIDGMRPTPAASPEPGAPARQDPYDLFINSPIIKSLQAAGAKANIRVGETVEYQPTTYRSMTVRQLYTVTPVSATAGGSSEPIKFVLSVQRGTLPRESMSRWMIARFDPPTAANGTPAAN